MPTLQRITADNGVVYYRSPTLHSLGAPHAFATRLGGVSTGPYATLNLGNPGANALPQGCPLDEQANIDANFARLQQALDCPQHRRITVRQVHGCDVLDIEAGAAPDAEADALLTHRAQTLLAIRVADCVPILLASDDGQVVAAVHAGWRGIVAGVIHQAVAAFSQRYDVSPAQLCAAVGPAIGLERYEVGDEVAAAFDAAGLDSAVNAEPGRKAHVNLGGAARHQLLDAGLSPSHIDETDRCTFRDAAEFFSHRRDQGCTGRNAAVIALAAV